MDELIKNILENPQKKEENIYFFIDLLDSENPEVRLNITWSLCYLASENPSNIEKIIKGIVRHSDKEECSDEIKYILNYLKNKYPDKTEEIFSRLSQKQSLNIINENSDNIKNIIKNISNNTDNTVKNIINKETSKSINEKFTSSNKEKKKKNIESIQDKDIREDEKILNKEINKEVQKFEKIKVIEFIKTDHYTDIYRAIAEKENLSLLLRKFRLPDSIKNNFIKDLTDKIRVWNEISSNENIVTIYDWGKYPEPWILTEYYKETLEERSLIGYKEGVDNSIKISKALSFGHKNNVLHLGLDPRDIVYTKNLGKMEKKPMINNYAIIKVYIDYFKDEFSFSSLLDPRYAAPEYFDTDKFGRLDRLTDIYNLGAVIYKLLTGIPPFEKGNKTYEIGEKDSVVPSKINKDITDEIDHILKKATNKEKLGRYENIDFLIKDLEDVYS